MTSAMRRTIFFGALLLVWWALAKARVWDHSLFPSPGEVIRFFRDGLRDGSLIQATAVTLRRVVLGYFLSLAVAVPLGVLTARFKAWDDTIGSVLAGLQALPSICWLPLALVWFGLSEGAIQFVVVMGSLVSIAVSIRDGIKNLAPTYTRAARTMGFKGVPLYLQVVLPASLPAMLTGAKLGWAYAWRALMAGELLYVSLGLGRLLTAGRELADMAQVIGVMLVIIGIGLFTDNVIFGSVEAMVRDRFGFDRN